jgi:hypothetical protein
MKTKEERKKDAWNEYLKAQNDLEDYFNKRHKIIFEEYEKKCVEIENEN